MNRDSTLAAWKRALERTAPIARNGVAFPVLIEQLADRFEAAPALLSEHETVTYRELAERARRYAGWAVGQGIAAGDVVCLMLPNSPDYLAAWLGITRIGGVAALLNPQLDGASLTHAIGIAAPRHLVVGAEFAERLAALRPGLDPALRLWSHGGNWPDIARLDAAAHPAPPLAPIPAPALADTALYIYTSGTTGLPKAARISHLRIMQWALWFAGMVDTQPGDRMYHCLPMHHAIGGVVAIGAVLAGGGSVVLRQGFSAGRFWDDIVEQRCTLVQYIGELCRYLVNAPPHPRADKHRLRLCVGNGLRPDVWAAFERRFRIPRILEFYASTEGNVTLYNCPGRPGAIGHIPAFLRHRSGVELIRIEPATGEPLRGPDGCCWRCDPGEIGEAIGRIADGHGIGGSFDGYTDKAATERRVLRDAFGQGDAWFRTGDLMRRDAEGYFFFVDRIGDTYRWKGENVSTSEVEQVIAGFPGIVEAVVYGVALPGSDGRAGMAALRVGEGFDPAALYCHLRRHLPAPACPVFLRLLDEIAVTSSWKPVKTGLVAEGCDPDIVADRLYVAGAGHDGFVPLDAALYRRIIEGNFRL